MLTCDDCGLALNPDVGRISEIKMGRQVCRSCRITATDRAAYEQRPPDTNPCGEILGTSPGIHPTQQPYFQRRRFTIPELEPKIEQEKNVPVMATVLQAALDWPPEEIEALAEHLFEIATAMTMPEAAPGLIGNLSVIDYMNLMDSIGQSVVATKSAAVITDVL